MTIASQVRDLRQAGPSPLPPEVVQTFAAEQQALRSATDRSGFVAVGDVLEPFALADPAGRTVSLDDLLAAGPTVLVFYRGAWCPYCNITLTTYRRELAPALRERGVTLAAISPQQPDGSLTMQEKHDLDFPVLSDADNALAGRLGIVIHPTAEVSAAQRSLGLDLTAVNGQDAPSLPMPTVLVVDRDRTVRFADVHPDYTERTEVQAILDAVDALRD